MSSVFCEGTRVGEGDALKRQYSHLKHFPALYRSILFSSEIHESLRHRL